MSKIAQAALDPSCLMCLTPNGWWSLLRQGVVWPGSPRNFATEPAIWRNFMKIMQGIVSPENISFEITFENTINNAAAPIFHGSAASDPFGVYQYSDGTIRMFSAFAAAQGSTNTYIGAIIYNPAEHGGAFLTGEHTVRFSITGTSGVIIMDDVTIVTFTEITRYTPPVTALVGSSAGFIYRLHVIANETVAWNYPSIPERLRLITTDGNVIAGDQYFEAADTSRIWTIKTALPAGIAGTVLAKINGEYIINPAQWNRTTATFTGASTDTLSELLVFNQTLAYGQIAYLCGIKRWEIPVSSGNINIATVGFQNLRWTFPDGSTSTAASINQTVAAGVITCEYVGLLNGQLTINNSSALASSIMRAIDLPRVTNTLSLNILPGLTGTTADLPRVTTTLYLNNLPGLTGTTADLPRVTYYLQLNTLPGLTGTTADLPVNVGERRCYNVANVTGALSVVATNTPIYFYATGATALEYDETVHNCVVAGGLSKTLHIGTGTSAGDADIQTLRDRGWSVTIY